MEKVYMAQIKKDFEKQSGKVPSFIDMVPSKYGEKKLKFAKLY